MKNRILHIVIVCFGIILLIGMLLPAAVMLAGSFMSNMELNAYYFQNQMIEEFRFVPVRFTPGQYYEALIGNTEYTRALLNTVWFALVCASLTMLIAMPAAYALALCRIPGKKIIAAVYLTLMLLPYQAIEMPHYFILRDFGILGSDWSVVLTNVFDPFEVMILAAFFMTISTDTLEAAAIDGAGTFRTFLFIVIPQMKHGIITVTMLKLLNVWNLAEQPIMFLDNTTQYPLAVMLQTLSAKHAGNSFAFATLFVLPLFLVYQIIRDDLEATVAIGRIK